MGRAYRSWLLGALLGLAGCSHEVVLLDPEPPAPTSGSRPLGLTVSVLPGAFDRTRLRPEGVLERFSTALREANLFQGVLYPVPRDIRTEWELELVVADEGEEPDSNFWKAAIAAALPPVALIVRLENEYTLHLEALLLRNRTVIATYVGEARVRHRYGPYANRSIADAEGMELAVRVASRAALGRLHDDLPRIGRLAFGPPE